MCKKLICLTFLMVVLVLGQGQARVRGKSRVDHGLFAVVGPALDELDAF